MKLKTFISFLLLSNVFLLSAQNVYYWTDNNKRYLTANELKRFVLVDSQDTSVAQRFFSDRGVRHTSFKQLLLDYNGFNNRNHYWSIASLNDTTGWSSGDFFIYDAPFFITQDGIEVGLSHLFYVKISSLDDTLVLQNFSHIHNVEIIGNSIYRPLWFTLSCSNNTSENSLEMANVFFESGLFEAAEPDIMANNLQQCTNDSLFSQQWNLFNTGQNNGTAGIDIKYCVARNITTGDANITIAIIDEGVDTQHPDLNNFSPISRDLMNGTPASIVYGSHGTACAGIIGATTNNEIGLSGIAPSCPLMIISTDFNFQVDVAKRMADGIDFAWHNNADVISNSWTVSQQIPTGQINAAISNAVTYGRNGKGCVVVFASGNKNHSSVEYPASNENVISVGAVDRCGYRCIRSDVEGESCDYWDNYHQGSSYGQRLDVVAPGVSIVTTDRHGFSGYSSTDYTEFFLGTSSACPHVSGVAALMLSVNPNLTYSQVRDIIRQTAQKVGEYDYENDNVHLCGTWNEEVGYGLLNAQDAVATAKLYHYSYSIVGISQINTCYEYSYQLIGNIPPGFEILWETSPDLCIVSGQGTSTITVRPLCSNSNNSVTAKICFEGAVGKIVVKDQISSVGNGYPAITNSNTLIMQNTLWYLERSLGNIITIDSGAVLTITNTLHCTDSARIIVRPGGTLIVDGGTLTSACAGAMWQGIEVVGDRTKHQTAAHQGTVIFRNGATIENAHCAIKTGLEGNEWLTAGGIVQCTGTTFRNNRRAVEFYSYADTLASGNIADNKSWFKNCTFTLDSTNLFLSQGMQFLNHVTLWDVKGVSFEGCTFENSTTGNIPDRKHGIYALGAGFKVNTLCNTLDGCNCYGAADTSLFAGFSTAVEVGNDGCPYSVTIDEAKFENNGTGVSIQACDYATVTRCTFDLSTNPVNTRNTLGLRLDNSAGFHVEGNTFQVAANAPSSDRWGVYVLGSVKQNNSLYRNGFENLTRGVFVTDTNGLGRTGLCFSCNTFTNCAYGIYVSPNGSIAAMQGNLSKGADNSFTGIQTRSLNNLGQTQVNYYHSSNSSFILHNPTGVLTESNLATLNPCNPTICDQGGNVTPVTGFGELVNSLLTPAGNSTATAQNAPSLEEVSQTYYAAVRRIMADSVESLPDLLAWHTAAGALASPYALTEIFAAMDNSTGVSHTPQSQADAFSVGASHTPPISQPEMDNYAAFRALAASLRPSSNNPAVNWPAATPAQIDELQRIAEANTGRSSTMAKGVLCFFFDICYEEEWESSTKAGVYSAKGTDVPQWTYWELALTEPVLYPKTFSLMEDTVLQGQSFRKSDFLMNDPGYHARNVMLKEDSTGMYYWDDILQETRVLYDYTAGEGDIYTVFPFMGDTLYQMKVTVDSVRVDQIDNQLLRVYYVTTASVSYQQPQLNWTFDINGNQHARIVEHIGATGFLLPMETALNDHFYSALCEYSDENIYYHPNDTVSCDEPYVYGLSQHDGSGIRVYPNPAHSSITVTCDRPMHGMVAYNRLGQPVYANANLHGRTEFTLDVSSWPAGLYLLQLTFPNGEQATRKVVKD